MDQNLKCLSAAEEKVLTVKPREALCTARFRFCFAAASPPLVTCRVLSHLLECSILSRLSASLISSFLVAPLPPQGLLPGGDLGAVGWGIRSHLHPRQQLRLLPGSDFSQLSS